MNKDIYISKIKMYTGLLLLSAMTIGQSYCREKMKGLKQFFLIFLMITISLPSLKAQTSKQSVTSKAFSPKMLVYENLKNSDVLRHFQERFICLDTLLNNLVDAPIPTVKWHDTRTAISHLDSLYDVKRVHETKALHRRSGLELTGQTYVRPEDALRDATDDDDVSVYKAKVQAEVGWNIINSRFYQGKQKEEKIRLANELDRLQQDRQLARSIYEDAAQQITDDYNYYIGVTIAQRLENLDVLNEAFQFMLENDRISNDKRMEVMNDKMDAEYQLSLISAGTDIKNKPLYRMTPTQVNVDTVMLWRKALDEGTDARIAQVKEDIVRNESRLTNYLGTMRLTPFVRWSSYWTSKDNLSNNIDAGLRFTVPLYNESGRKKRALDTQIEIIRQSRHTGDAQVKAACMTVINRVENINRAIRTENYHIQQLEKYVALRRNAYRNQKNGYSYVTRLEEYNEYLKSMERMYKLMLSRSLAIVDILKITGLTDADGQIFIETKL